MPPASRAAAIDMERGMGSDNIGWQKDVDGALAQAAREKRPILLDFTAAPA
jgi:hypothetical protein